MSVIAGGATGIGGLSILFMGRKPNNKHLACALASAAGVMLTVSLCDLLIPLVLEDGLLSPMVVAGLGWISFSFLMKFVPSVEESILPVAKQKTVFSSKKNEGNIDNRRSWRLGMIMLLTLTAHNFPEGLAVSVSNLKGGTLGFDVTLAISLHNIPEGLAIAVPMYAATGSRSYAIAMACLSGLSEPLGALFALTFLRPLFATWPWLVSYVLVYVAGIMISVSVSELIPEAYHYREYKWSLLGFSVGSAIMLMTIYIIPA